MVLCRYVSHLQVDMGVLDSPVFAFYLETTGENGEV
jgi:hypothetical protein